MEITSRNQAPMLNREEVIGTMNYSGATPTRLDVRKEVAKATKAKEELIIVRQIKPSFGETSAEVTASIYKDLKSLENVEKKHMIDRHAVKAKEAEAAPAEVAEAKPAEEAPVEEPKAEEKPAGDESPKEEAKKAPAEPKAEEKEEKE